MEQSFSTSNLKQIWDLRTRRGDDRLLEFYPDVKQAYLDRRDARRQLRQRAAHPLPLVGITEAALTQQLEAASRRADEVRDAALAATSERLIANVEAGEFSWGLREMSPIRGRRTFAVTRSPEVFFAEQVLQRAVLDVTNRRPMTRQGVIAGVSRTLDSNLPKLVIRTDFEKFYESIDHSLLRSRLDRDLLSPTFRGLIGSLLSEASKLLGQGRGLPTGVGLSARLAEYFLLDFDREMLTAPRTLFYGRYVDDIVTILGQKHHDELDATAERSKIEARARRRGLALSPAKTDVRRTDQQWKLPPFDLLGYELQAAPRVTVSLTKARQTTLKARVDDIFRAWGRVDANNHGERRLLLDRLRYVTGNFRLENNKRNAFIGMYFSNPHLSDPALIDELDVHLAKAQGYAVLPANLARLVAKITFRDGFMNRRLYRFNSIQLERIRRAWNA